MRSNHRNNKLSLFNLIGYSFITVISILCLIPFLMVISSSLTDESSIYKYGYSLIPHKMSFETYKIAFEAPMEIIRGYGITVSVTVLGTLTGLFITALTAYVLYRKEFKYRYQFSFLFYFTSLFSGGLVSYYIFLVRYLGFKDKYYALILPLLLNVFYILIMRNFMNSVPYSIIESAKIDGAGDFEIFLKIVLRVITPAIASIGLFIALGYWNDWFQAMLFIENYQMYPLQYMLYRIITSVEFSNVVSSQSGIPMPEMPKETIKMAMTVISTGPIIFLYPFVQKYFVKGITIGAVKG
jgi:putative aldouronate transport system permease protein